MAAVDTRKKNCEKIKNDWGNIEEETTTRDNCLRVVWWIDCHFNPFLKFIFYLIFFLCLYFSNGFCVVCVYI